MINLLSNAVKFADSGHIRFSLKARPTDDPETILLCGSVEDTGRGIKNEDLPRLFGIFSQVDTKKNRNIEGTGLGLAITKNLLELMGGTIAVSSEYGEGACFTFTLPQKIADADPLAHIEDKDALRVAVCISHPLRAQVVCDKIASLGVVAQSCSFEDAFDEYSHVFFDYSDYLQLSGRLPEHTRAIALTPFYAEDVQLPETVARVYLPLTSDLTADVLQQRKVADEDLDAAALTFELCDVRCLIVDDNEINLIIAESLLEGYTAQVDTADSALQALGMVEKHDYDVIFMDHMMPEMDGIEATERIRKLSKPTCRTVPIIALTANAMKEARIAFMKGGMNDFLAKPIEVHEMERVLKTWLPVHKWRFVTPAATVSE